MQTMIVDEHRWLQLAFTAATLLDRLFAWHVFKKVGTRAATRHQESLIWNAPGTDIIGSFRLLPLHFH